MKGWNVFFAILAFGTMIGYEIFDGSDKSESGNDSTISSTERATSERSTANGDKGTSLESITSIASRPSGGSGASATPGTSETTSPSGTTSPTGRSDTSAKPGTTKKVQYKDPNTGETYEYTITISDDNEQEP